MTRPTEVKTFKAPKPAYDRNALYLIADSYDWVYEPTEPYTKTDVCKPGFFEAWRDELKVGARITCRLGKVEDGINEVELQVIECPKQAEGDVVVSVGSSRSFTPCRHDGTLADEDDAADEKEKAA